MSANSQQRPGTQRPSLSVGRSRSGLTALELVCALSLFVIVFGTLLIALNSATNTWTYSTDKNRDLIKARNALDLMASDLACAVAPRRAVDIAADTATTLGSSQKPLFIAEQTDSPLQSGLYFVMFHPSATSSLSLALVAYHWTTNGLARHVRAVEPQANREIPPDLCSQLADFKTSVGLIQTPTNILTSAVAGFGFYFYQPTRQAAPPATMAPDHIGRGTSIEANIRLADLPDYADLFVAYVNAGDWSHGYTRTNYLTRRVTLPAAQASRLP